MRPDTAPSGALAAEEALRAAEARCEEAKRECRCCEIRFERAQTAFYEHALRVAQNARRHRRYDPRRWEPTISEPEGCREARAALVAAKRTYVRAELERATLASAKVGRE